MSGVTGQSISASRAPITTADGTRRLLHEILYADVSLQQGERLLLGRVVDLYEERDELLARVKHFNGEDWPLNPNVATLTVLGPAISTTSREHGFYCPVRCWCVESER